MTGNQTLDIIFAIQGLIVTICTLVGLLAPKGSYVGGIAAKIGTDIKNQTVTVNDTKKKLLKHLLEAQEKEMLVHNERFSPVDEP